VDTVGGTLARRDLLLFRARRRPRLETRRPRAQRAVRLPGMGDAAHRARRSAADHPRTPVCAGRDSRTRGVGPDRAGPWNANADLLRALARATAFPLPSCARAAPADRLTLHRGTVRLCRDTKQA